MEWFGAAMILLAVVGMYLLYSNGYLTVQSKVAVIFMGHMSGGRNSCGFTFTTCDGYVQRVLKVKEKGIFRFDLEANLSKGLVRFHVLDAHKLPLLTLDSNQSWGRVVLEPKHRYFVQMQFINTSGDCRACWEME